MKKAAVYTIDTPETQLDGMIFRLLARHLVIERGVELSKE